MNQLYQQTHQAQTPINPHAMINNMLQSNPKLKSVYDLAIKSRNPRDLFFNMAKQKGVDPGTILGPLNLQ